MGPRGVMPRLVARSWALFARALEPRVAAGAALLRYAVASSERSGPSLQAPMLQTAVGCSESQRAAMGVTHDTSTPIRRYERHVQPHELQYQRLLLHLSLQQRQLLLTMRAVPQAGGLD